MKKHLATIIIVVALLLFSAPFFIDYFGGVIISYSKETPEFISISDNHKELVSFITPIPKKVKLNPLPYGPYFIKVRYSDKKEFTVKFFHDNARQKDLISFKRLNELNIEVIHTIKYRKFELKKNINLEHLSEVITLGWI